MNLVDSALQSSFGESSSKMKVTVKKTVLIREYETEVVEASTELDIEDNVKGSERVLIGAILKTQMEYMIYVDLLFKQLITQTDYDERKQELDNSLRALKEQARQQGVDVEKYLKE